mmetsp:Transcript_14008/g.21795  ORF Transcript_14008/g.21795 Transcript_14008/m.21795 type:complete len:201 (-) Transcript_14008:103-705(-)
MRPCSSCPCARFQYVPFRPEEVGEWWLPRRKGFQVKQWRAKCKCKHGSDCHAPNASHRCTSCGCSQFISDFLCVVCDRKWEEHETVTETAKERQVKNLPIGQAFLPLAEQPSIQQDVFSGAGADSSRLRPKQKPLSQAEKSVRLMPKNSGGLGLGSRRAVQSSLGASLAQPFQEPGGNPFVHQSSQDMLQKLQAASSGRR